MASSTAAAWENVIRPWFKANALAAWRESKPALVVVPFRSHASFFRERLLAGGISLLGLHFVTPPQLREVLLRGSGLQLPLREHLRLLLAIAATEPNASAHNAGVYALAKAISRAPDPLLRAIDQINAAGWSFAEAGPANLRGIAARFAKLVAHSGFHFVHEADRHALAQSTKLPQRFGQLFIGGFDGAHWPLWPLLRAAVESSDAATVVLANPHTETWDLDEAWVGTWEETFGAALPAGDLMEPASATATDVRFHFLVGRDTTEQARAIVAQITHFLSDDSATRIGVVFPGPGALPRLVAAQLEANGIAHNDTIAHLRPVPFEDEAWQSWLQLQQNPRVNALLAFVRSASIAGKIFDKMPFNRVEDIFRRAIGDILIDDLAVLQEYCARLITSVDHIRVADGLRALRFLPAEATLSQFLRATRDIFAQLEWSERWAEVERLSRNWSEKVEQAIPRHAFLRWLAEITSSVLPVRAELGDNPYSRIQLLPFVQAEGQWWSHLILAGMNEGAWPPRDAGSGFISDDEIAQLNARTKMLNRRAIRQGSQGEGHTSVREGHTLLLGARERRNIVSRQFASVVESADVAVALTANLFDESAPGRTANPSEFFTALYSAARGTGLSQGTMDALRAETHAWLNDSAATPSRSRARQARIAYDARRRPDLPAGEYDFALREPPAKPISLSATDWEKSINSPALLWLKKFLGVEPEDDNAQAWNLATGHWVHHWLRGIAGGAAENEFVAMPPQSEINAIVRERATEFRKHVETLAQSCSRAVPDWWISGWRNALFVADRLASKIAGVTDWPQISVEWRLPSPQMIHLGDSTELLVRGRIDLILARGTPADSHLGYADVWVIDYKTGNRKTLRPAKCKSNEELTGKLAKKLRCGDGIQLALYALALQELGAKSVGVSLLTRALPLDRPQLGIREIAAQSDFWSALAWMQTTGIFGMRGAVRSEFDFGGAFPLATIPIDKDLLERKWTLTHPAFAAENGETEE